jgi:hypothetical protein
MRSVLPPGTGCDRVGVGRIREEAHALTPSTENGVARRRRHKGREKRRQDGEQGVDN